MHPIKTFVTAALFLGILVAPAAALTPVYTTDFETFNLGSVDQQNGWQGYTDDTAAGPPIIAADPTGGNRGKVLCYDPLTDGKLQGAFYSTGDLVAGGNSKVSVSWDQWRADLGDNMWFADDISYNQWYGLQWDVTGRVHPQGFNDQGGNVPLAAQQWQNVRIDLDFTAKTIEAWVDGVSGGSMAFAGNYTMFRGIDLELQETAVAGNGPLYIDNISISANGGVIPEPGTMALMAIGALPLLGLRRRKS